MSDLTTLLKNDEMSLEEKLAAIDAAMAAQATSNAQVAAAAGLTAAPVDPQDFLMCDSCQ